MEKMLRGSKPKLSPNVPDIKKEVMGFVEEQMSDDSEVGTLHFHFSGHGVHNARIFLTEEDKIKAIESNETTKTTKTPVGECLVGTSGKLYSIHDLKSDLLNLNAETIIITVDCCRSESRSPKTRGKSSEEVKLKEKEAISQKDQEKIVVLYGSLDGHSTLDARSFTKELFKVTQKGNISIPILDLASKVNESWKETDQRCKADLVQVGDNWKYFYWPSNIKAEGRRKRKLDQTMLEKASEPNTNSISEDLRQIKEDIASLKSDVETLKTQKTT